MKRVVSWIVVVWWWLSMAAITSAADGLWSSTSTWTGGTIPGNGDTVTIQATHDVEVTDSRTVGHSPGAGDTTAAVLVQGTLTISGGGTLISRGDLRLDNTTLTLDGTNGVPTLEFDASAAGIPSTARYRLQIGINAADPNAKVIVQNCGTNRAVVRSNSGGANGRSVSNGNDASGQWDVASGSKISCLRFGDASNPAFEWWLDNGQVFRLRNAILDACGAIGANNGGAYSTGAIVVLENVTMKNTVASVCGHSTTASGAITGGGVRSMTGCVFDKGFNFYGVRDWTIANTMFGEKPDYTGGPAASVSNVLYAIPQADSGDWPIFGNMTDCYVLRIGNPSNQHGIATPADFGATLDGIFFDAPDMSNGAGDCITVPAPSTAVTHAIKHCIVGSRSGGGGVGTLFSLLTSSANLSISAIHNTYDADQGIFFEVAGAAGQVTAVKSNLAWSASANTAWVINAEPGAATDVVASGNVTHNGKWNPASTDGYDDDLSFSSGTPGANDISGDPSFVDRTRTIKTWDTSLGGAGTVSNALAELAKRNDAAGYNSAYAISNLLTYLRAGYAPRNNAFKAAHDSVTPTNNWIGAVEGVPVVSGLLQVRHRRPNIFAPGLAR